MLYQKCTPFQKSRKQLLGYLEQNSKLDTNSGFCSIPFAKSSFPLTLHFPYPSGNTATNICPLVSQVCQNSFPRKLQTSLQTSMEDIIMFGIVQQDTRLTAVLRRITEAGGTLNPDKWKFSQCKLKFLGQIIYAQ